MDAEAPSIDHASASPATLRWWVLRTKARQEKAVSKYLATAGVEHFLPTQIRKQPWLKGGRSFAHPLFPGYVFAKAAGVLTEREMGVGRVVQLVRVPDQAQLEHELAQIRAAMLAGAVLLPAKFLERGTPVVVTHGPLKGVEGVVERLEKPESLWLQVQTLGRALIVEISPAIIALRH